jgi:ATP-dependent Lhr-like helicase
VESKRGVQLCVGLERLRKVAPEFQLVALSATVGTPEVAARFLFGDRWCTIVRAEAPKEFAYAIEYPVPDPSSQSAAKETYSAPDLAARLSRINSLIESHTSTLIFVNSRTMAEMLGEKLARLRKDVGVHHGSLPREERERVEQAFKTGALKALVCTSTLELGIDVGSVDLVVQYMSPRQVTSLVQRVGRSGHTLGKVSKGVLVTVSADDVLESSASVGSASKGRIEPTRPFANSLDVLAHQIAGYLMDLETMDADRLYAEVRKATPYRELSEEALMRTVKYMAELRKIRFDGKVLSRTKLTREYYYENLSMIPDETRYLVVDVSTNQSVGILGEEFVLLSIKVGVHFVCKGKVWQVEQVAEDRKIYVTPVEDPLAAVPGWDGEMLPIPYELAIETGRLRREISEALEIGDEAVAEASKRIPGDAAARALVLDEISEHKKMGAPVPSDRLVLVEGFGKYLIIHACFGESVNRTFAYTFEEILSRRGLVRVWWLDGYRILMELTADTEDVDLKAIAKELMGLSPEELERTYAVAAQRNFPFPARVKHVAERFGALKRGKLIAHPNLCSLPTRFEKTPIFEEALQETGRDLIDMERSKQVLLDVAKGHISVETFLAGDRPTPIAYGLLYRYLEVPEAVAPDSLGRSSYQRMKASIFGTDVSLLCVKCGTDQGETTVGELPEEPKCIECGSGLLVPCYWGTAKLSELITKRESKALLNEDERAELSKARRGADLVLSYGKKAVVAQTVYGIGPQTASRILAEMHDDEEAFYRDLLEAKIRFVTTRQFWGN